MGAWGEEENSWQKRVVGRDATDGRAGGRTGGAARSRRYVDRD